MTTSLGNSEVGECSNTYLCPLFSTSIPNGVGENTTVFPRSEIEGSLSVSQSQVALPVGALQIDVDGGLVSRPWRASPVGESGCTEYLQVMVFKFNSNRNSILGSNMLSGGLVSEDTRSITLEFVSRLIGPSFLDLFLEFL